MATNNFLIFDESQTNTLTQAEYAADNQRIGGVTSGLARSALHNKAMHQSSVMAAALGQLIADSGKDAGDEDVVLLKEQLKATFVGDGNNLKTYTNLSQIGLTAGSETIESILTAMPINSILYVEVGASNADIYPTQYGTFIARKLSTSRWFAEFYPKETADLYVCSAKIENSTFAFYDWEKKLGENVTAEQIGAVSKKLATFDDANDVKTTGFYAAGSSATNIPPDTNSGVLIVLDDRGVGVFGNVYQMFISSKSIYFRYWTWSVGGNDWTSWYGAFNSNNVLPITAGGTGANTEAKARKNLKTDMVLIDGYESLGLSDDDFGTSRSDFIGNITKIVDAIDSNDNFMVEIYDSSLNTSNFSECIAKVVQGSIYVTFTKAYYSVYIYGRNDANYPIIVDVIVDNVGTPYMLKYLISSNRAGERTVSNGISLFHGTNSDIWCSRNKPFFTYKGDGSTSERTIKCGDNTNGYFKSSTLLISSRTHIGFATGYGGLFFSLSDGTSTTFTSNEVEFDSDTGYLTVKTDNDAVNKLNVSYTCQAL